MIAGLGFCGTARAQTWTNPTGGAWSGLTNWNSSVPNAAGALANFGALNFTSPITVLVDGPFTVGKIVFGNQNVNPGGSWFVTSAGGGDYLNLAINTGLPIITVSNLGVGQKASISANLTGTNGLAINGPGNLLLSGANGYGGITTVINGATLTIGAANTLPVATILALGDTNSGTVGNLNLTFSQTLAGLVTQSMPASTNFLVATNVITLPAGSILTVNGNVVFGSNAAAKHIATDLVTMYGGGTFAVNTNGGNFRVGATDQTSSAAATTTIVDLSGLAKANITLATNTLGGSNGNLFVGDFAPNVGSNVSSVLILASNTTINATSLQIGVGGRLNTESLLLGSGSNVFNISSNFLGVSRDEGQMYFYTNTGTLTLRAADGFSRSCIGLGYNIAGANGASNQFMDFGSHYVDLYVTAVIDGFDRRAGFSSNYFGFSNGILDTTGLQVGVRSGTPTAGASMWVNVCNLGGGTILIGTNGIVMGTSAGTTSSAIATNMATLNISGGSITVNNNIVLMTQEATNGNEQALSTLNITGGSNTVYGNICCLMSVTNPGPYTATLTLNGGFLDLTGHAIGGEDNVTSNPANYVNVINLQSGTLTNVGQINGGAASLAKTGLGVLNLGGNNTYTGGTAVASGTLIATSDGALGLGNVFVGNGATLTLGTGTAVSGGYIAISNNLILAVGAAVNLSFAGTNAIAGLSFDGGTTFQAAGTWGSLASSATYKTNLFQGSGLLLVELTVPTLTSTLLTSATNISFYGQSNIFTATVSGSMGIPTGTIAFYDGTVLLGTAFLVGGVATLTTSLPAVGTNSVTASYSGDSTYQGSSSTSVSQTITLPLPSPLLAQAVSLGATNGLISGIPTVAGYNYILESTPSFSPPVNWSAVSTVGGTGGTITNLVPIGTNVPAQFFRYQTVNSTGSFVLQDQQGPHALIVIGTNATMVDQFAAQELQSYVGQITGSAQLIPIVTSDVAATSPATNQILIGIPQTNPLLQQAVSQFGLCLGSNCLGDDGYIIKTLVTSSNHLLLLTGSTNRSSLFAVYNFLETCGVRFFGYKSLNEEIVPAQLSLVVPTLNIMEKPTMKYRFVSDNGYDATNTSELITVADWGAKNRCNTFMLTPVTPGESWSQIDLVEVQKRGFLIAGPGHILAQLTPATNLFSTHPEYFPLINGQRNLVYSSALGGSQSYCYSNAMQIVVSNTVQYYEENPFIDLLAVYLPDGSQHSVQCQDSYCAQRSISDWYLTLLNNVDAVLRTLPAHPKLMWLSYDECSVPPTQTVPMASGEDFILVWCNEVRDFAAPMNSPTNQLPPQYLQWNPELVKIKTDFIPSPTPQQLSAYYRWQGWSNYLASLNYAGSVSVLEYYNLNVSESLDVPMLSYCQSGPWPSNLMQVDFQYYTNQGISGWQNCTDYYNDYPTPYWNRLSARLMWNPNENMAALDQDFYQQLYGPAAVPMQNYFNALWPEIASRDYTLASYNRVQAMGEYLTTASSISAGSNSAVLNQWLPSATSFQAKCLQIKQAIPQEYNPNGSPLNP